MNHNGRNGDRGLAVVTGAGQGLGAAIALELAHKGFAVLLVARTAAALEAVRARAAALNGGRAHVLAIDLLEPDATNRVEQAIAATGTPLTCLVNNAGHGLYGRFADLPVEQQLHMMRLNMEVPVQLTHAVLPLLRLASRAYLLNISSMTAYGSIATLAAYGGSKAFVLRWSRALGLELKGTGVRVTCACPGSIITGFTERAGMQAMDDLAKKFGTGPEPVAKTCVRAMLKGRAEVVPGFLNRVTAFFQQILPPGPVERVASGIYLKRLP
ncbi:MAG: SDR family oxidoreductase [Flavobacteriales bacterium]|nr:SDR family oxidoreductase [Flavobacteriales bacterium]MBP6391128.1 SDR family oxidoreductase [Flavobacteriales bacterium]MBP6696723.1 SDR family oxidoreductase [Flavobacteriales bacterium]